jgi:membrane protein YdbS with pleckstrin-like domain
MILPTLILGLVAAVLTFFESRHLESWQSIVLYVAASVVIFFGWIVPLVRQLVAWVEISTARLVWRDGIFGQKRREVSWYEVSAVEFVRGRVTVFIHGQEPLVLKGLPKGKQVASELQNLLRGSSVS